MAESKEVLEQSLQDYEMQLLQINSAISNDSGNSEALTSLRDQMIELISLTKDSLISIISTKNNDADESLISTTSMKNEDDDPLDREYELFKAELGTEASDEDEVVDSDDKNEEDVDFLIGTRCKAPFSEQWSSDSRTYHNAMISGIIAADRSSRDIQVNVIFINPTCREMVPCQYHLIGECKFNDDQCHFSHGYVVHLSELKTYEKPDFSRLQENIAVLAKDEDTLWKRAIVTSVLQDEKQCCIKFESGHKHENVIDFENILPLNQDDEEMSDDKSTCDNTSYVEDLEKQQAMLIEKSLTSQPTTTKLGDWEKYTTGIGSRLMARMGYVVGTGLGKRGEGRVEPVTATVLPRGTSLDYCMDLKERAGGNTNLSKVDQLQRKFRRRKRGNKHTTVKVPENKSEDVFSFLNSSLSGGSHVKPETQPGGKSSSLKTSSSQALNVEELKLSERMEKKKYELYVLRDRLTRQKAETVGYNTVQKKVKQVEGELRSVEKNLKIVQKEQSYRQTMRELTEF